MMQPHHHIITDTILVVFILTWIVYSIAVVIYLNFLTRKYLTPIDRTPIVNGRELKGFVELQQQFSHHDSINVLVLSGGGVRGSVPLHVLSYLEEKTGKKTGELFPFIAGSSTGAISAIGLCVPDENGGYKFSAKDILKEYEKNSILMFSSPWYHQFLSFFGLFAPRFLSDNKLKVLEGYVNDMPISELNGGVLIPVYNVDTNNLQLVKNWGAPDGRFLNANYLAKDLVNGATSPPMLFPATAFKLNGQDHLFIDPAILLNNPILHVFIHMNILFPDKHINMVFIGNGGLGEAHYDYRHMFSFGLYGIYQYLFSAPALSSKLYIDLIKEHILDTQGTDSKTSFFWINSLYPYGEISPTDTSKRNFAKIRKFSNQVLSENKDVLDNLALILTNQENTEIKDKIIV